MQTPGSRSCNQVDPTFATRWLPFHAIIHYHGKGPARTAKELLKAIAFIQEKKADVKVPFLALHGDRDVLTNPQGSQELYMQAASTDKTLKIYPGLYHDLLHEPEKDQVYQDILAWLNQRSSFR